MSRLIGICCIDSFPTTSDDFSHWRITFANSLYPDQAGQNVGSDLDPTCLTFCNSTPEFFFLKVH